MDRKFKAPTKTVVNPGEMYFTWYLDELIKYGFVKSYEREAQKFRVMEAYMYTREVFYKSKDNKMEAFNLLPEINYTYDFKIIWEQKALNILTEPMYQGGHFRFGVPQFISHYIKINDVTELVSFIDVKPHANAVAFGGGKMASYYTFPFVQKILLATKGLYINKTVPVPSGNHGVNTCLFAATFTPNRYKFTDAGQQERKIKFRTIGINSFYENRKSVIDKIIKEDDLKNSKKSNQQTLL